MKVLLSIVLATMFVTTTSTAQIKAKDWNGQIKAGWNLGNQFECSAPGQDGESMAIGNPDDADNAGSIGVLEGLEDGVGGDNPLLGGRGSLGGFCGLLGLGL